MSVEHQAFLLAVLAAVFAAGRAYWIKATDTRLLLYGASNLVCLLAALALLPVVGLLPLEALPYLLLSTCIYTAYIFFQLNNFQNLNISLLEPLQKGVYMFFLLMFSSVLLDEIIGLYDMLAVFLLFAGLYFLLDFRAAKHNPRHIGACAAAGILSACLVLSDTMGIRVSGEPVTYIVWNLMIGAPSIFLALMIHRKSVLTFLGSRWKNISMMCLCDVLSYGLVLYILYMIEISSALPLLNLGIVLTALFGAFWLKEKLSVRSWSAIAIIAISISMAQFF